LPTLKVLIVLLVLVALITWLLWHSFIKVYSKAQLALKETLAESPIPQANVELPAPPFVLRDANLDTVTIASGSRVAGKLICDLPLRTETGASIIGIERHGTHIINPLPDEELQAGDQLLLLGNRAQLDAARRWLSA
jgi:CPA2 family monovalent cation:H+ antiporter-2